MCPRVEPGHFLDRPLEFKREIGMTMKDSTIRKPVLYWMTLAIMFSALVAVVLS